MKPRFIYAKTLLAVIVLAFTFNACQDKCTQMVQFRNTSNYFITFPELRSGVSIKAAQVMEKPGKIYVKDNYLFINEQKKGVHIIDNSDPKNPKAIAFIAIPGNSDMAVKGTTLYADSYTDFVAFDISNPQQIKELTRLEGAFTSGMIDGLWWSATTSGITDTKYELTSTTREVDCENASSGFWGGGIVFSGLASSSSADRSASPSSSGGSGTGGSMARFAVVNDYLYAVTNSDMQLFDIQTANAPKKAGSVNIGWGIETIFPYKGNLFIGSTTGMFIYDNSNPQKPTLRSQINHFRACDPVVVQGNYAYVTLRSANNSGRCGPASQSQLDVIDITNLSNPVLSKVYPMESPYGLGIDQSTLFICEGTNGLKTYNANNPLDLKLTSHFKDVNSYDVIPLKNTLMMIGKDGLYQFDYSDPTKLKLLSVISVKTATL